MTRPHFDMTYNRKALVTLRQAVQVDAQDVRIIQDGIDAKFREHERQLFVSEGASGGEPWQPLSPDYSAFKTAARTSARAKKEPPVSTKLLRWTESMMRSLTVAGHPEHVSQAEGPLGRVRFVVGTLNKLAGYHYRGNDRLPARNPIAHTEAQKREYLEVVRSYMLKKWAAIFRNLART